MKSKFLKTLLPVTSVAAVAAPMACLVGCGITCDLTILTASVDIKKGNNIVTYIFKATKSLEDIEGIHYRATLRLPSQVGLDNPDFKWNGIELNVTWNETSIGNLDVGNYWVYIEDLTIEKDNKTIFEHTFQVGLHVNP